VEIVNKLIFKTRELGVLKQALLNYDEREGKKHMIKTSEMKLLFKITIIFLICFIIYIYLLTGK
jgi:hypothetical protein